MGKRQAASSCSARPTTRPARGGVTFVELLLALALSALLVGVVLALFTNAVESVRAGREGATRSRLFRVATLHAREDLRNARAVTEASPGRLSLSAVRGFSAEGEPLLEEIVYAAEGGRILRRGAGGEGAVCGAGDGLSLSFAPSVAFREDADGSRYEVTLAFVARDGAGVADSLEIRVVPPMMARRRTLSWPETGARKEGSR